MEKRNLLDFVLSNSIWKDGRLIPNYRKPFDLLANTNVAYAKEKAASTEKDGLFDIWLPVVDTFRTLFTSPPIEVKLTLEAVNRRLAV